MYTNRREIIRGIVSDLKSGASMGSAIQRSGVKSHVTILNWRKKSPRLDKLIKAAEDYSTKKRTGMVVDALFKNAMSGNIAAQIFWLKNRAPEEWRDVYEGSNGNITNIFTIIQNLQREFISENSKPSLGLDRGDGLHSGRTRFIGNGKEVSE